MKHNNIKPAYYGQTSDQRLEISISIGIVPLALLFSRSMELHSALVETAKDSLSMRLKALGR